MELFVKFCQLNMRILYLLFLIFAVVATAAAAGTKPVGAGKFFFEWKPSFDDKSFADRK